MGQILGLGITHYPNLAANTNMSWRFQKTLEDPRLPERFRSVENWHPTMREQWGSDNGAAHSDRHRRDLIEQFRKVRRELDRFEPDFVLIWGDDQYENFREDCVPAFSVLAYESIEIQPWKGYRRGRNVWDESEETTLRVRGHRAGGKYLATALLEQGIDVAYAYRPLHHPLGHAFTNSVLYLDYDRKGFPYPIVPFAVNAYGRWLIGAHGAPQLPSEAAGGDSQQSDLDPPAPQPWRCFEVGAAVARALERSPWRVAIIASSSWSHSFLVQKNGLLFPDVEADRRYYEALKSGDWQLWRNTTLAEVEERGHHEVLNWFCLVGAMHALGRTKPDESVFLESWITNSDKVFAVYRPS
ncbi:MAG: DODA-type extradiol aromatic ring-opening family dioxygenase [Burkholderiales bacterium]